MKARPTLSICIATMPKRAPFFARLIRRLNEQIQALNAHDQVEILHDDDMKVSTGTKRTRMYFAAQGEYICSIDDDDFVPDYYIKNILEAAKQDCDAIAMSGVITFDGRREVKWFISKDLPYQDAWTSEGEFVYVRYHNHLSPIKGGIAINYPFPNKTFQEDYDFAKRIHDEGVIKTEAIIGCSFADYNTGQKMFGPYMYHYNYRSKK